jgi:uncharacterized protein
MSQPHRLCSSSGSSVALPALSRRRFLTLAGTAACTLVALPASSQTRAGVDTHALECHEVPVPVAGLPHALDGFTIAHISDTHLRQLGALEAQVVAAVQDRNPALVVLTGDMVSSCQALPPLAEFCQALRAPGRHVFAIRGNHEVQVRIPLSLLRHLYRRTGVQLLLNEHVRLHAGLTVIGTENSVTGHYDLRTAVQGLPATPVQLHLTHAPEVLEWSAVPPQGFTLSLAGHTHGGQIRLPGLPPLVPDGSGRRFVAGWYPDTLRGPAYVSRGIGTTIIPLRFHCPPELPFLRLIRA